MESYFRPLLLRKSMIIRDENGGRPNTDEKQQYWSFMRKLVKTGTDKIVWV
ncbi:MAG: hypothetical protein LBT10_09145 [Methanobrevibacter sp.]|nr:hypothetical protein [Methanobrevibacter sp.]